MYINSSGIFLDLPLTINNWLLELGGQSRSEMIVRDSVGSTVRLYLLNFPPPHYLSDDYSSFSPQALMWPLIIGGGVIIFGVATYRCITIANKTREEVEKWEDEIRYDHGAGADKLVHCVGACLVILRAGRLCGILAARATERAGTNPFGAFIGDPMDEKANFDGVACGDTIDRCANNPTFCRMKTPWFTGNDWLDCPSCCRQKGYRGRIKWR